MAQEITEERPRYTVQVSKDDGLFRVLVVRVMGSGERIGIVDASTHANDRVAIEGMTSDLIEVFTGYKRSEFDVDFTYDDEASAELGVTSSGAGAPRESDVHDDGVTHEFTTDPVSGGTTARWVAQDERDGDV